MSDTAPMTKAQRQKAYRDRMRASDPEYKKREAERKRAKRRAADPSKKARKSKYQAPNARILTAKDLGRTNKARRAQVGDLIVLAKDLMEKKSEAANILQHVNRLRLLHNKIYGQPLNGLDVSFLNDSDTVLSGLKAAYPNANSRRSYLSSVLSVARRKELPSYAVYTAAYSELTGETTSEVAKNEKSAAMREKWITPGEIRAALEDSDASARDQMIVGLYTLIPARRRKEFQKMYLYTRGKKIPTKNYLVLSRGVPKKFVYNVYKTSKTYGPQEHPIPPELTGLISAYLGDRRKGLFIPEMSESAFSRLVQDSFQRVTGKPVGINDIRHIQVTEFLKSNPSLAARKELASQMGHGVGTQAEYSKHK